VIWKQLVLEESGQDTFEYLLVAGAVAVVIVAILVAGFVFIVPEILGHACPTVDPLVSEAAGECLEAGGS
jgi:Flp pilus assembly pilin Flp